MRKNQFLKAAFVAVLLSLHADADLDQFTPLIAAPLTSNARPFRGADERVHIVYELVLTNTNITPATLTKVEVLDASDRSKVLASYEGKHLSSRLRTTGGAASEDATIPFNNTRLLLMDLALSSASAPPGRLLHRIGALAAPAPERNPAKPIALTYTAAPLDISRKLPEISPPLSGKGWVALNGCCGPASIHRSSSISVNGGLYFAQRFAIDWMRLDDEGRLVHGDVSDVHNYTSYGANVMAVADGTVVETLNDLDDQKPGVLPDRKTITLQNVDGNHVILNLGDGVFAFYAHLQKGSVSVAPGDRVRRGQSLGKLGNTGNSSGPHLHFHLMEGASVLGSNGIPYTINSFAIAGQVPAAKFEAATGIEGRWNQGLLQKPSERHSQYPLDLNVVNFESTAKRP